MMMLSASVNRMQAWSHKCLDIGVVNSQLADRAMGEAW